MFPYFHRSLSQNLRVLLFGFFCFVLLFYSVLVSRWLQVAIKNVSFELRSSWIRKRQLESEKWQNAPKKPKINQQTNIQSGYHKSHVFFSYCSKNQWCSNQYFERLEVYEGREKAIVQHCQKAEATDSPEKTTWIRKEAVVRRRGMPSCCMKERHKKSQVLALIRGCTNHTATR